MGKYFEHSSTFSFIISVIIRLAAPDLHVCLLRSDIYRIRISNVSLRVTVNGLNIYANICI